jgi:cytochrome P450
MAINPGIQEKAQTEIDRIVGRNRLPEFSDRPKLPYLEGIYREVLRSRPPTQLGCPHSLMEDDHYKGYFIPKGWLLFLNALDYCSLGFLHPMLIGAMVIGNIWQLFLTHFFHEY